MDSKDYLILNVLNETRNITRAAEVLFMTQPALSKRIRLIEQEFDTTLLIRSHQGVNFTPSGEKVLEFCQKTSKQLEQVKQELDLIKGEVSGTLNAGYSISYGTYRLAGQLSDYHKAYPKVNLQIISDQSVHLYQKMLDGSLDLAIIRGEYPWDQVRYLLAEEKVYLVYSRDNHDRKLEDYMYISRTTDPLLTNKMLRWLREKKLTSRSSNICVDNITTCRELVQAGVGWAILPEIALEDFEGIKEPLFFENGEPFLRNTYILCQQGASELSQVQHFIRMIQGRDKNGVPNEK